MSYPPPPAKVETLPQRPKVEGAVWIDGEWATRPGRRWRWKRGRWLVPPPGARYAPWVVVRAPTGQVYYAPGSWQDAGARPIPAPPPLALAEPTKVTVVNELGQELEVGRDLGDDDAFPSGGGAPAPAASGAR